MAFWTVTSMLLVALMVAPSDGRYYPQLEKRLALKQVGNGFCDETPDRHGLQKITMVDFEDATTVEACENLCCLYNQFENKPLKCSVTKFELSTNRCYLYAKTSDTDTTEAIWSLFPTPPPSSTPTPGPSTDDPETTVESTTVDETTTTEEPEDTTGDEIETPTADITTTEEDTTPEEETTTEDETTTEEATAPEEEMTTEEEETTEPDVTTILP